MDETYLRVCAYIDLDAFHSNIENMHRNIDSHTQMVGVIKTDGYGHGAVALGKELEAVPYFWGYAVATAEEALELRENGLKKPILILGYTFPYAYESFASGGIRPAVFTEEMLDRLAETAHRTGEAISVHIKVDTGMSRIGIRPDDAGLSFVAKAIGKEGILVEGLFTHFARADEADKTYARAQYDAFDAFVGRIEAELGYHIPLVHCSNSAGIIELPYANKDLVRAGITLYGLWPSDEVSKDIVPLKPLLSLKSHVVYVKEIPEGTQVSYGGTYVADRTRRIATVPVGYGDGYPRGLSSKGCVLIRGKRAPILGRVCMDQFMVDVTEINDARTGDEVTLIGCDGSEQITIEELSALCGRFNYELACDLGRRIPRVYIKNGKQIAVKDCFAKQGIC